MQDVFLRTLSMIIFIGENQPDTTLQKPDQNNHKVLFYT